MSKPEELDWFDRFSTEHIVLVSTEEEDLVENLINWLKDQKLLANTDLHYSRRQGELLVKYDTWLGLPLKDRQRIISFVAGYKMGYADGAEAQLLKDEDLLELD